jgi:hypothetical protein
MLFIRLLTKELDGHSRTNILVIGLPPSVRHAPLLTVTPGVH